MLALPAEPPVPLPLRPPPPLGTTQSFDKHAKPALQVEFG